tara:strand:- start:147 stop:320 length:174 start_codon:yes stop_codon:yes gene_type:complete
MTEKEIEMAMDGLFLGAARVRANKFSNQVSKNVYRPLTPSGQEQFLSQEEPHMKLLN